MNMILLGPPGSGKGTHAQKLMQDLQIPQISTGDILRKAIREKTPIGQEAQGYIDQGMLVPDDVVIEIVRQRLAQSDCENGYILDGFPRTVYQAEVLSTFAQIDVALNMVLQDEVIVRRLSGRRVCQACGGTYHTATLEGKNDCLKCGTQLIQRPDDTEKTVQNRLSVYAAQTAPLIDFYSKKGIVKNIDCSGTIPENHQRVLEALKNL